MTGLEKIVNTIEEEALARADEISKQANEEAAKIMEAAIKEADKKCAEIEIKSKSDCKDILDRAESGAALIEKKAMLEAKQQIIGDILSKARKSLDHIQDAEYQEIILRMVKKYAHRISGQILFSPGDKKRLPKDFEASINKSLSEKAGATLSVSEQDAHINGGFILKYGDIEENCTFDALFQEAKDDLQDKVNALLFQ